MKLNKDLCDIIYQYLYDLENTEKMNKSLKIIKNRKFIKYDIFLDPMNDELCIVYWSKGSKYHNYNSINIQHMKLKQLKFLPYGAWYEVYERDDETHGYYPIAINLFV